MRIDKDQNTINFSSLNDINKNLNLTQTNLPIKTENSSDNKVPPLPTILDILKNTESSDQKKKPIQNKLPLVPNFPLQQPPLMNGKGNINFNTLQISNI